MRNCFSVSGRSVRFSLLLWAHTGSDAHPNYCSVLPRLLLGTTQPSVLWAPTAFSSRVKQPEHKANLLPPSSAEVKNVWNYSPRRQVCLHNVHRDNFAVILISL
jgi:hypothetical protein